MYPSLNMYLCVYSLYNSIYVHYSTGVLGEDSQTNMWFSAMIWIKAQGQLKPLIQTQTGLLHRNEHVLPNTNRHRKDDAETEKPIGTTLKVQYIMLKQTWNSEICIRTIKMRTDICFIVICHAVELFSTFSIAPSCTTDVIQKRTEAVSAYK